MNKFLNLPRLFARNIFIFGGRRLRIMYAHVKYPGIFRDA